MPSSPLPDPTYPSKRDAWIVALVLLGAAVSAYAGVAQFSIVAPLWLRLAVAAGCAAGAALMLWILYGTKYVLADDSLLAMCGPFRYRVPLAEIDSVRPSRNPLSSPACSLDRLLIEWREGRRRLLISPAAKPDFLRELAGRCPHLVLRGDRLERAPSA
jgi:hypothetical protein